MIDGEWVLTYPGINLTFDAPLTVAVPQQAPSEMFLETAARWASGELETDDRRRPRIDGVAFGADIRGGQTVEFDIGLRGATEADVMALWATVSRAWRGDAVRSTPGAMATLRTRSAGQERAVYGRPRRCAPDNSSRPEGYVSVLCDFACVDDLFYAVAEQATVVPFVPTATARISYPVTYPVTFVPRASASGLLLVGGDMPAWPVVTIKGPILNPTVTISGSGSSSWFVSLKTYVVAGAQLVIDTRPWALTVTRLSDGASFAGALTRTSRLDRASLPPGSYVASLAGVDASGTSSVTVAWRNTYASL